jgi:hypothetical protein
MTGTTSQSATRQQSWTLYSPYRRFILYECGYFSYWFSCFHARQTRKYTSVNECFVWTVEWINELLSRDEQWKLRISVIYNGTITEPYSPKPSITSRTHIYTGVPLVFFTLWVGTDFALELYYCYLTNCDLLVYIVLEKRTEEGYWLKEIKNTFIYNKCAHWSKCHSAPLVRWISISRISSRNKLTNE